MVIDNVTLSNHDIGADKISLMGGVNYTQNERI